MPLDPVPTRTVVRGACPHDCPDTCAMLVTVEDGRAIEVRGAPDHPPTGGALCTKVARYLERTYSDQRVLHPMKRVGRKGEGRFERIGWDEALDTIAARFGAIAASPDGPQAIVPYSYAGTMGLLQYASMDRRFFHRLGASLLDRTICATAGKAGWVATIGAAMGTDVEQFDDSRLILIWGSNPVVSNLHFWTRAQEAKRRGAKLIAIDPYRSQTAEKCHQHIALLPGTDAALALGMMHVLIAEDLVDHDYVARHTVGFDALRGRAAEFPPERVAADLRHRAAKRSSTSPATTARRGRRRSGSTTECSAMPAAATRCAPSPACRRSSAPGAIPRAARCCRRRAPTRSMPARSSVPTSSAGTPRTINMSTIGDALLAAERSADTRDLRLQLESRSRSRPNRRRSRRASRATISSASCTRSSRPTPPTTPTSCCRRPRSSSSSTSTARTATCTRSRTIRRSRRSAKRSPTPRCSACSPRGWASPKPCFRDSDDDLARQAFIADHPRAAGLDWDTLKATGFQRLAVPAAYAPFAEGGFPTPSGKCEFHSEALAREGHDPLPTFVPPRESVASNPALAKRYPLAFISPPARNFLNSSFANLPAFVAEEKTPRLDVHPDGRRAARDRARGDSRAHLQRSRELHGDRARHRPRAAGRRRRAVDLVEEALAGRRERQRRDRARR